MRKKNVVGEVCLVPLSKISVMEDYPFRIPSVEDKRVSFLVEDINAHSVLVPLTVKDLEDGTYSLIDGYKRKAAAEYLKLSEVPVIILNKVDAKRMAIDVHIGAKNLLPSEKAKAYYQRYKKTSQYGVKSALRKISDLTGET